MTERTEKILEAAVQGFIDTGFPISSGWLYEQHDFGIKPAMIRSELEELSRQGFLEQPHHSAGRVPSDLGYEFFVEGILKRETYPKDLNLGANFFEEEAWPDFLGRMSSSLGILSAAMVRACSETPFSASTPIFSAANRSSLLGVALATPSSRFASFARKSRHVATKVGFRTSSAHRIYKTGLEELIENWDEPQLIKEVVRDFANLEDRMEEISDSVERGTPRVFIGRSPLTESGELSVVAGSYGDGRRQVILVAIGPKRMDYKKAIKIFSAIGGSASGGKNTNGRRK